MNKDSTINTKPSGVMNALMFRAHALNTLELATRVALEAVGDKDISYLLEFGLTPRQLKSLQAKRLNTINDVANLTQAQLFGVQGLGCKGVENVKAALAKLGITRFINL